MIPILHLAFLYGTTENLVWEPRLDGFMLVKEMAFATNKPSHQSAGRANCLEQT